MENLKITVAVITKNEERNIARCLESVRWADDIVVIEWADRIAGLLPDEHLQVEFTYLSEARRRLSFAAHGARYVELLTACYSDLTRAPG